ncbi:MAG TPA: hypothetical protein VER96_03075 [Polyangiaceae bacterium]|nr:hypothetical protein [Polyangiaceae bacterium]
MTQPKKIHIALGVRDPDASVPEYSQRLAAAPVAHIRGEYALWRTEQVNFSIRRALPEQVGLRHLGWEDPTAESFSQSVDLNGILWERFTPTQQLDEIAAAWPATMNEGDRTRS